MQWAQPEKTLRLKVHSILGERIEFHEVRVLVQQLQLLLDSLLLLLELILDEVSDNQHLFVELLGLNQVMEEIVDME